MAHARCGSTLFLGIFLARWLRYHTVSRLIDLTGQVRSDLFWFSLWVFPSPPPFQVCTLSGSRRPISDFPRFPWEQPFPSSFLDFQDQGFVHIKKSFIHSPLPDFLHDLSPYYWLQSWLYWDKNACEVVR